MTIIFRKWVYLISLSIIWGSSYILIKKGLIGLTPLQLGSFRILFTTIILLFFGANSLRGISRKEWNWILQTGFYGTFFPTFLFSYAETEAILSKAKTLENVRITVLMGMASYTDNNVQLTSEFSGLQDFYNKLQASNNWTTLSMGMSNDYKLAVSLGSTIIRVGSLIFGSRN